MAKSQAKEQPNLDYVDQMSVGKPEFRQLLIDTLCKEFLEERHSYTIQIEAGQLTEAALLVHKLKHKIGLLGMTEGYELAGDYEEQLRHGTRALSPTFEIILKDIALYLDPLNTTKS